MTIGEKIKLHRTQKGMTQGQLADKLCVSYQAISKWERGKANPDLGLINPICRILGISADELFGIVDIRYEEEYKKYRNSAEHALNYEKAREAVICYPDEFKYILWLADVEYQLAFDENLANGSTEYFNDTIDAVLAHYETVINNSKDDELIRSAVSGKVLTLRFLERIEEADWSAEFEYSDKSIITSEQIMQLSERGRMLAEYLKNEN